MSFLTSNIDRRLAIVGFIATLCRSKRSLAAPATRSILEFGVKAGSDADQTSGLQSAFEWLAKTGSTLTLDRGARYRYSDTLEICGGTLVGNGASFIALNANKSCIYIRNENVTVSDINIVSCAKVRSQKYDAVGMMVIGATHFSIRGVSVRGVACGGFGVDGSHHGEITGIEVRSSLADGFHITNGSSHIQVNDYKSFDTGDDGFAIVTYDKGEPNGSITRNIIAQDISIIRSKARGVALVGAKNVVIERVVVEESACAGIYMNSEFSYSTYGNEQINIRDAELVNCVTRNGVNQGCVHIQGRTKLRKNSSFNLLNSYATRRAQIRDVLINGMGLGARAAVVVSKNAEEIDIRAQVQKSGPTRKPFICDIKDAEKAGIHISIIPHVSVR